METVHLEKDDYEEPRCPFCKPGEVKPVPMRRIIEKFDEYLNRNDYNGAERHLKYWLEEAQAANDGYGKLTIYNELIGLFRKTGKAADGLRTIDEAIALANALNMEGTVMLATTLINAATALKAFDKPSEALPLYVKARDIYEEKLLPDDSRLGGLYNNKALTVMALGDLARAKELFEKALCIMSKNQNGEAEMAITYCNLADLAALEYGTENGEKIIGEYLDKAYALLNTESLPKNGYYAFVCEKCAPTFGYYGYFSAENELNKRAVMIYERT